MVMFISSQQLPEKLQRYPVYTDRCSWATPIDVEAFNIESVNAIFVEPSTTCSQAFAYGKMNPNLRFG